MVPRWCACVQKLGNNLPPRGIEPWISSEPARGTDHWATLPIVLDLEVTGLLMWAGRKTELKKNSVTEP